MVSKGRAKLQASHSVNLTEMAAFLKKLLTDCKYLYQDLKRNDYHIWEKARGDFVTDVDIKINNYMFHECRDRYPFIGWFSEESADDGERLTRRYNFIVDPVDGTSSMIAGRGEFVFSIALEKRRKIVVGAALNPETDELYWAIKDRGASKNGKRITAGRFRSLNDGVIPVSVSEHERGAYDRIKATQENLKPMGSTAYKILKIAEGIGPVTFSHANKMEWDLAACALILEEAGGKITTITNRPLEFNQYKPIFRGYIASNDILHEEAVALTQRLSDD